MTQRRLLSTAAALVVALLPAVAAAAPPAAPVQVDARLAASELEVGQATQLSVTVSGDERARPRVPQTAGLTLQPMGSSRQITIIGGAIEQRTTHHFQVIPRRAGTFTIGPVSAGGAQAPPVRLRVTPASARARGSAPGRGNAPSSRTRTVPEPTGRRAFLVVDVDDEDLVVGESTPITVRAYVKAGTRGTITGAPELSSDAFAIHDLVEDARHGQTEVRGTPYATLTWRGKLTALLPGEHDVSANVPATLEWRELVRTERPDPFAGRGRSLLDRFMNDPAFGGSLFDDPFFSGSPFGSGRFTTTSLGPPRSARVTLEDAIGTVTVREPPEEGRPDAWDGAVGRFEIEAEATPTTVRAGEPVTLRLRVSGEGSFERVHHALVPEGTEGLRVYPVTERLEADDGRRGAKVFEQTLVPTAAGPLTLPALSLSYYDPAEGAYATATSEPIVLDVQPSADGAAPVADLAEAVGPRGLAPNAVTPGAFVGSLRPLPRTPWPWLAALLAMGLAVGAAIALRRRDPAAAEARRLHRSRARALRQARRGMRAAAARGDGRAFFLAARAAVQQRLGATWDVPAEAVTLAEAEVRHDTDQGSVPDAFRDVLERADAVEFAGADPSRDDLERWRTRVERALAEERPR